MKIRLLSYLNYGNIKKLLDCYSMLNAKTIKVPMQDIVFFLSNTLANKLKKIKYAAKKNFIIYVIIDTQIDIVFTIFMVSQFAKILT